VNTELNAHDSLDAILAIERSIGRIRHGKWRERIIDIDIIYYDDQVIDDERLTIPHPGIPYRRFVLEPLCELIPDAIHPILKVSNAELLKITDDQLRAEKIISTTDVG
jgi:2-amino-4-hydroxy-6-hydroxymethyldihydropteridine diphosphokinase